MAIDTHGYVTVSQAAARLGLSIEQVRRKLREGKLRGHRLGNQWFVEESQLEKPAKSRPLIPRETIERVARVSRKIDEDRRRRGLPPFDVVEMLRRDRAEH